MQAHTAQTDPHPTFHAPIPGMLCWLIALLLTASLSSCDSFYTDPKMISVTFDTSGEGWTVNDYDAVKGVLRTETSTPVFSLTGGNPDGYIYHVDKSEGSWYFVAPDDFVQKLRNCYSQTLTFDLKQSATDQQGLAKHNVVLVGNDIILSFNASRNPGISWTNYSVKLDSTGLWRKQSAKLASADEVKQVINTLEKVLILGEFRAGPDTGGLDNVIVKY